MPELPPRYEPLSRLGAGGGGEVWSVRDRVSGRGLALKVLSRDAGEAEIDALVRETVALSGLEGLGVPRVVAFGALRDGRRYMVRELVQGTSLDEVLQRSDGTPWIEAIATACDQLTVVHRAGLLHGDIKPANVIVGADGRGTLVDLGLAAPWREGGAAAQGLTPKYAAPELLQGEPLTVRAEVYAIGATLSEALGRRGDELPEERRMALAKVAARATEPSAAARWPSADELASALRRAAGLPPSAPSDEPPWPVLGLEATARALLERVGTTPPGGAIAVQGPRGSGRTTLARRLAWTLGVHGCAVSMIEAPKSGLAMREVVEIELAQHRAVPADGASSREASTSPVVIVDDAEQLDDASREAIRRASDAGARLVVIAPREVATTMAGGPRVVFVVPPLDVEASAELVRRSVPSLPDTLRARLVERIGGRPGSLRAAVRQLAGRAIVSKEDIDAALGSDGASWSLPPSSGRAQWLEEAERALDLGRFDDAVSALGSLGSPRDDAERVRVGLARARVAIGRGDPATALTELANIEGKALSGSHPRAWRLLRARACLRAGQHADAARLAQEVVDAGAGDELAAEALSVRGVALAFTGEDTAARAVLEEAIRIARATGEPRVEAVALGSSAIAHQRAGRTADARRAYEGSLAAA
jgi:serine/threonine-protein kinase PknK